MTRRRPRWVLVARAELVRRFRAATATGAQRAGTALTALVGVIGIVAAGIAGFVAGRGLVFGTLDPFAYGSTVAAGAVLAVGFLVVTRSLSRGDPPALAGQLTATTARTLALGTLLAEYAVVGALYVPAACLGAAALAVGSGRGALGATALLSTLALFAATLPVWVALVALGRHALLRVPALARHRLAVAVLATVAYMAVLVSGNADSVLDPAVAALSGSPVGWFADLALLAVGGDPVRAAGAVVLAGIGTAGGAAAVVALLARHWSADPRAGRTDPARAGTRRRSLDSLPVGRPAAAVIGRCWRRGIRAPVTLLYVPYPLFLAGPAVAESVGAGRVQAGLVTAAALYGPWAAGAAFTLNPLGDEGVVLPGTLTSGVGGREYVGGRVLAGALPGAPLAGLATFALGLASPRPLAATAALAALAALLAPAAACVAAAFGTLLPNAETTTVFRSRDAVLPDGWAFVGYSLALGIVAAPALAVWTPEIPGVGVPTSTLRAIGTGVSLLAAAIAAAVGFAFAARRVDGYELE
jgi:hypothetical protein